MWETTTITERMNRMRKTLFLAVCIALALCSCNHVNSLLAEQMMKKSGILENTDYLNYERYVNEERIDQEGYYTESVQENTKLGSIHITFAENNNIKAQYFEDSTRRILLSTSNCYMNPGDTIYALGEVNSNIASSMYEFAGFRAFELDEQGNRKELNSLQINSKDGGYLLTIPKEFTGTEVSIEPIGSYSKREIILNDYLIDDLGNRAELDGTWTVNEVPYQSDIAVINPVSSYIISYRYDSDKYFFMSSEPECYYSDNIDGLVIFKQRDPTDSTLNYSVELHKYIDVSLISDVARTVSIDGGDIKTISANTELPIQRLRYGQLVNISTNREWSALERCQDLILTNTRTESGDYIYSMIVPEKGGEFHFNPLDYYYDHGTITFTCFGNEVKSPQLLAKGSRIYYEQNTAEDGYWLAPGDNVIIVGESEDTEQQLQNIHFTPMVKVEVSLTQPEFGGKVLYSVDGKIIDSDTYSTYSGTIIEMKFEPWEGWILNSNAKDGDSYSVLDNRNQIVRKKEYDIGTVFTEDQAHKPELSVTLEKSVGKEMEFSVAASGFKTDIEHFSDVWYNIGDLIPTTQDIVRQQKIGTEVPITITLGNKALQSGQAVKFVFEKVDRNNNKESETRYITNLTTALDPFYIYSPRNLPNAKQWYKSVQITVGIVDVETFMRPVSPLHSTVMVRNLLTNEVMGGGELIEGEQKVTITITPDIGYYITGKQVSNGIYQETMKYSDYIKSKSSIIDEHVPTKYYSITLDSSDQFASYAYKLDGKEVTGTILAKEGQKLTLTYEITDSRYKLSEGAGGLPLVGWGKSFTKATKDLIITEEMDGSIITKQNFGITTERG